MIKLLSCAENRNIVSSPLPEIAALKDKYKDQITIKMGLEFDMQVHTIPQYEKLFSAWPFDFAILSGNSGQSVR